jgi:hypothetical protein
MAIKYINIYQSEALENYPKVGFLVCKRTIWQPWANVMHEKCGNPESLGGPENQLG